MASRFEPTWSKPGMDVPPEVRRKFTRRIEIGGVKLKIELLPGLWLKAPFYGILISGSQVRPVSLQTGRPYARATPADFERLVRRIRIGACSRAGCGGRYLVGDQTAEDNPQRVCRRHWRKDLRAACAQEEAASAAREARADAKARAGGFRYKAGVWIHGDGDDYAVVTYFKARPTKAQLRKIARSKRSMILDDASVERL